MLSALCYPHLNGSSSPWVQLNAQLLKSCCLKLCTKVIVWDDCNIPLHVHTNISVAFGLGGGCLLNRATSGFSLWHLRATAILAISINSSIILPYVGKKNVFHYCYDWTIYAALWYASQCGISTCTLYVDSLHMHRQHTIVVYTYIINYIHVQTHALPITILLYIRLTATGQTSSWINAEFQLYLRTYMYMYKDDTYALYNRKEN